MGEQIFYIEEHISGAWDNDHISLILKLKGNADINTVVYTNKHKIPYTSINGTFTIVKDGDENILRFVFKKDDSSMNVMEFKIDSINAANNTMQLSSNGVAITFVKVA